MAAYTTTQAGNWNNVATWGGSGFPTNGDTATIVHTVTYNINDDTNTITTINLNTNGTLQWLGGAGTLTLRFTNMVISGGKLIGRDGTFLRCLGYIQVANTAGSEINMKGSVPNLQTTLNTTPTIGDGYISVVSSSGFGVGDYISVYDYANIAWNNQTNECFIINGISGNDIYLRRFVGTKFTLTQNTILGTNIFYTDSDVRAWTAGMKFVLDTEVFEVDSIDIFNKIIYSTTNAGSTYNIGEIAYETGIESSLVSGYTCYKLCATVVSAVAGNNYIDVSSSGGWSVNDILAIGGCTYAQRGEEIIQSISVGGGINGSDRIYLAANLTYSHAAGGIVVKVNRDCVFHGYSNDTIAAASGYIYILSNSANRTFRFENFEMRYYGNTGSVYYAGLQIRNSYNRSVVLLNVSGRHSYKGEYNGFIGSTSYYYTTMLNNVVSDTQYGLGCYSSEAYAYRSGNIVLGIGSVGYWMHDNGPYISWNYNSAESCNSIAFHYIYPAYTYFSSLYNSKPASRLWYSRCNYAAYSIYFSSDNNSGFNIDKFNILNPQGRILYKDWFSENTKILKNFNLESGDYFSSQEGSDAVRSDTYKLLGQTSILDNYNFIKGNRSLRYLNGYANMDENIRANNKYSWIMTPKNNAIQYTIGFFAIISGLKGKIIKVGAYLRKDTTTNATVFVNMIDDRNNTLASSSISSTNTWEWQTISYTIPNDQIIIIRVGGYGSIGNFWISNPTIYTDDCITNMGALSNFWIKGDPIATGIRLTNGVQIR